MMLMYIVTGLSFEFVIIGGVQIDGGSISTSRFGPGGSKFGISPTKLLQTRKPAVLQINVDLNK